MIKARIAEAVTKSFSEFPEVARACAEGNFGGFRFLADNIASDLGREAEYDEIYNELFTQMGLATGGAPVQEHDEKYRRIACEAFKLGLQCGRSQVVREAGLQRTPLQRESRAVMEGNVVGDAAKSFYAEDIAQRAAQQKLST